MKGSRDFTAFCGTALPLALSAQPAAAQQGNPVELTGDVKAMGTERKNCCELEVLESPDNVVSSDEAVFSTSYRNTSGEVVKDFALTTPLSPAIRLDSLTALIPDGLMGKAVTWGKLAALTITNGMGGKLASAADEMTYVRWESLHHTAGAAETVKYPDFRRSSAPR